jgi:hypothetical protein
MRRKKNTRHSWQGRYLEELTNKQPRKPRHAGGGKGCAVVSMIRLGDLDHRAKVVLSAMASTFHHTEPTRGSANEELSESEQITQENSSEQG